jgi:hypothetical protein
VTVSFDEAAANNSLPVPPRFRLDVWIDTLDEDERAKVLAALNDPDRWSGERLAAILTSMGKKSSRSYVNEWRRAHGIRRSGG